MKNIFSNAQKLHFEKTDTFNAPSFKELNSIKVGNYVKVCTGGERFWIKVVDTKDKNIIGIIDNDLVCTDKHGLKFGDKITVHLENIYQIYK